MIKNDEKMIKEYLNQYEYDTDYECHINTVYYIVDYVQSFLKNDNTSLEKIMEPIKTEQEGTVLKERETNEETNDEGTRIVRTKQPEVKHEIKYSKYTTRKKYIRNTKITKDTKFKEIINKYEKDTDYKFDNTTYNNIKNEIDNIIHKMLALYKTIDEYTEQKDMMDAKFKQYNKGNKKGEWLGTQADYSLARSEAGGVH
jgi:hypothetical protein